MIEFYVLGKPQGKARPRFSRKSGTVYTPKSTGEYERMISLGYLEAKGKKFPSDCYVSITVKAFFSVPKSWKKAVKNAAVDGYIKPTRKPDIDNIIKAVMDGLNGVAYEDDKQVVEVKGEKLYACDAYERIEVIVNEVKM